MLAKSQVGWDSRAALNCFAVVVVDLGTPGDTYARGREECFHRYGITTHRGTDTHHTKQTLHCWNPVILKKIAQSVRQNPPETRDLSKWVVRVCFVFYFIFFADFMMQWGLLALFLAGSRDDNVCGLRTLLLSEVKKPNKHVINDHEILYTHRWTLEDKFNRLTWNSYSCLWQGWRFWITDQNYSP